MYDFDDEFSQTYTEKCGCGEVIEVSTQKDECPEYYTTVFVRCLKCKKGVEFNLPVN